jgi:hypothetical protein
MNGIKGPHSDETESWASQRRDAPATQAAHPADGGGRPGPVRQAGNAVPGKPDGEAGPRP